jgi:hypothetical protein
MQINRKNAMRRRMIYFTGAALGFASVATAIGSTINAPYLFRLHFRFAETTGRIIRVVPNSHGATEIEYSIQGTSYEREVPGYWVPFPHTPGKPIRVYYDPNNPSVASAVPADEVLIGQLPSWIAGSMLGSLFGVGVVFQIFHPEFLKR